jgi:phage-related tail protein
VVQDQLQTVRRLFAAQQADTRKLSEQVGTLTEAINGLRESFASAQATEPAAEPTRRRSANAKPNAIRSAHRRRGKSNG